MQPAAVATRYGRASPITPSDTNTYVPATGGQLQGLYIGGAGNVAARMLDGSVVTFSAVPAGTLLPVQCDRVMSTNTTATLIIGLR
jgi:hypothetical protein